MCNLMGLLAVWLCGGVAVWGCCGMGVWLCGGVVWLDGVWLYGGVAVWGVGVWGCGFHTNVNRTAVPFQCMFRNTASY